MLLLLPKKRFNLSDQKIFILSEDKITEINLFWLAMLDRFLPSGSSILVEYTPQNPNAEGLSAAATAGTE
jgi:hypothetical protein